MSLAAALTLASATVSPAALPIIGEVDPRFQSYNIEMVEITGGRFWKPYRLGPPASADDRYAYRPPIDLANKRLRVLARALGPVYVRVSGTWASKTFVAPRNESKLPSGFDTLVTPKQWRGLAAFLKAINGKVVLSAPTSGGTRNKNGEWQPDQLLALLRQSRAMGIDVAAVAFMNEPNLISLTGAPNDYSAADYARDYARFAAAVRSVSSEIRLLGPGAVGGPGLEPLAAAGGMRILPTSELIARSVPKPDVYNYHHYGAVSQRCATTGPLATEVKDAHDPAWLARTDETFVYHRGLRDKYAKGSPIWVTETAQAACGGSPWAATFTDTPRYLDQLGRLARGGVQAIMHNTLAASDYALIDETDFAPRPNYWAALLWSRLMGTRVLAVEPPSPTLRLYAHCLKGRSGGVALLAINLGPEPDRIDFAGQALAYELDSAESGRAISMNGLQLKLQQRDALPTLDGKSVSGGASVAARAATFVAFLKAGSPACR